MAAKKNKSTDVTFVDDVPKVTREGGGNRTSKYDELLNKLVERFDDGQKATARMVFDTVGQSTSRYQSIKARIEEREDSYKFTVAQRTEEEERCVYVKYDGDAEEPEEEEEKPAPKKKATKKAAPKKAKKVAPPKEDVPEPDEDDEDDEDEDDFDF